MKKAILILVTTLALSACDKVYINGDLDGMWRLESVVYPDSTAMPDQTFYSFQRHLVQVSRHDGTELPKRFLGILDYRGETLSMSKFYSFPQEKYPATTDMLKEFHLYNDSTVFQILTLDDNQLIMASGERTYTLHKW
ncbi:MAG: lipocalin-like domain-containing protein [Akkermansia sp.]|nr:lipocalin-like domain-containing protein [Akkermansia sp.]